MQHLRVVVRLHALLCSTAESTAMQCRYFKPRTSGSKHSVSSEVAGTAEIFKVLYCKIKKVFFIFLCLFLMYYLCEKYYKPITVQYNIANCVRLTLLAL